tara:strand:+ start:3628 stop:4512 length:885 start_codon:yes stop_codon:yes gene_type:complete
MVDTSGQADIRGLDIDKLAKGFADEENVFKRFVVVSKTTAREMRWYQKTSGFLDSTDTSGIMTSQIANVGEGALPVVVEQSWTRKTSYVRKYFVESPTISSEDIMDSDIDVLATNVRDLVRAVARQVDSRIYNVITESQSPSDINTAAATGTGWDDTTNGNPILDIMTGQENIRTQGYDAGNVVVAMDPNNHKDLLNYLIDTKGSSIPNFSSEQVRKHVVMTILDSQVVVSTNVVADSVAMWVPSRAATWKQFMPITSIVMDDPGIGKKIRVWEEGECILTDPKAVHLITDTNT